MKQPAYLAGLSYMQMMFLFQSILWYIGGATFVSLERSMTRRAWRVRKRQEKLLILCLIVLVSCFPLSCSNYLSCFVRS